LNETKRRTQFCSTASRELHAVVLDCAQPRWAPWIKR